MKTMVLLNGSITTVDDDVFETFQHLSFYFLSDGYVGRMPRWSDGKWRSVPLHRLIMLARKGQDVHHIDGNKLNNQRNNLQLLSKSEHMRIHSPFRDYAKGARKRGPQSGLFRGVSFHPATGKWRARIWLDNKNSSLGLFKTAEEAAKVWDKAALNLFGETVFQNFPS